MRDHNDREIERIIDRGFAPLPVDDTTVAKAIDAVVRRGKEARGGRNLLRFPQINLRRIYAIAAALVLVAGTAGYLALQGVFAPPEKAIAENDGAVKRTQRKVSILSIASDSGIDSTRLRHGDDEFTTDGESQMLLAVGERTRTVLFERSRVKVDKADSSSTVVALQQGAIALDVTPGGTDTVSVITPLAWFTQIGTRFSVVFDSTEGAAVEVYRGSVRVRRWGKGVEAVLTAGQAWKSRNGTAIMSVRRSAAELGELERVFSENKLERFLHRRADPCRHSGAIQDRTRAPKLSSKRYKSADHAIVVDSDIVHMVEKMAQRDDFHSLDSVIAHLSDPSLADTVHQTLLAAAERKKEMLRFLSAKRLLELCANGAPFPKRRREDASMRLCMLHKRHIETPPDELLKMIQRHRKRFPDGIFADDMAAEEISLLLSTGKSREAVAGMEQFFKHHPRSPHDEYFRYVYAGMLREDLRRTAEVLDAYKKYIAAYPEGKYGEDALYRIIQLSRSSRDMESAARHKQIYLRRYPRGRWVEEVKLIDVSERK
ncbi:MAG: FecR domain-containing protein [Chitinispirillaceae bacterium]|nr:FecR domain-containing protein [Chitinispirillaceae bacterium]